MPEYTDDTPWIATATDDTSPYPVVSAKSLLEPKGIGSNVFADLAETTKRPSMQQTEGVSERRVIRGVISLLFREVILKIVVLTANIIISRILPVKDVGIFLILGFFNTFLITFGSFGLGPSIVQRSREPTTTELRSLLTMQLAIAALVVGVAEIFAPGISATYHFGPTGVWLIRAMSISFLFTATAATPMALLERHLKFSKIAIVEILIGISYQVIAVTLVLNGRGLWSLVIATIASNFFGMIATYIVAAWRPGISLQWQRIFPMVRFGLKYQVNSIFSLLKDNIATTFVPAVLGATATGYIGWSGTIAYYPVLLVDIIGRVMFPTYSRVADDPVQLQRLLESTIRIVAYMVLPLAALLATFAPYIVDIVYKSKWLPAVPIVYFMLVSTVFSGISRPLIAALNAIGKPGVVTVMSVVWFVLDWSLIVPLVLVFGFVGFGIANAIVSLSIVVTVLLFRRYQPVRMLPNVILPFFSAGLSALLFLGMQRVLRPTTLPLLVGEAMGLLLVYLASEVIIDRHFLSDARFILAMARSRAQS